VYLQALHALATECGQLSRRMLQSRVRAVRILLSPQTGVVIALNRVAAWGNWLVWQEAWWHGFLHA
jgi:hypothetical protein